MDMTYSELRQQARRRLESKTSGKTRVVVQVGRCSVSSGAAAVAEQLRIALSRRSEAYLVTTGCDGACFAAPQVILHGPTGENRYFSQVTAPDVAEIVAALENPGIRRPTADLEDFFAPQHLQVMAYCGQLDPADIDDYIGGGGYASLADALARPPESVIDQVMESGLQERSGAYLPTAPQWQAVRGAAGSRRLVVNTNVGEPGLFQDCHLLEGVPHRFLEGALIAAYAAGASRCYVYIGAEANLATERVEFAIAQAQSLGLAGVNILGSGFDCAIEVGRGAGRIAGSAESEESEESEETTLPNASPPNNIERQRREPPTAMSPRVEEGPFPQAAVPTVPTVVNSVETLANLPYILQRGPARYGQLGLESAPGTKLICLSGAVHRPGLAEIPMGTTLREVIYGVGGGPPAGQDIRSIAVGGPAGGLLSPSELDTPLRPGPLHPSGVTVGAGSVIVSS